MYPTVDYIFLNEKDMVKAGVKNMPKCIGTMEELLRCVHKGDYVMAGENHDSHGAQVSFPTSSPFPEMPLDDGDDRRFMAMPAYVGGSFDMAGVKWYGSNMSNKKVGLPRSVLTVMLNDKMTGVPLCLMSANLLSAYRTGAVPGVGAKYLAPKAANTVAICGPGVMGHTALAAMLCVRPSIKHVKVKGRGQKSLMNFIKDIKVRCPQLYSVEPVDTVEELVKDSDIVIFSNTGGTDPSSYPFVKSEWLKPGCLIAALSCFDMDSKDMADNCKLVVEHRGLYEAWAREFEYPAFGKNNIIGSKFTDMVHDGLITNEQIFDLGDIMEGTVTGRDDPDQKIIYSIGGMPVEDIAWGKACYENAIAGGIGTKLRLWDSPALA